MLEKLLKKFKSGQDCSFKVKIKTNSKVNKIVGNLGGEMLKIAIAAPPEKGKANSELITFLSGIFNIPQKNIRIRQGETSPHKTIILSH